MTVMILTGMAWMPAQKAEAADFTQAVTVPVNGQWSEKINKKIEDTHYYRFELLSDGQLSWKIMTYFDNSLLLRIYSENMSQLATYWVGGGTSISPKTDSDVISLSKGKYYIGIHQGYGQMEGDYKIYLEHTSYGVNDQYAVSYDSPQTMALGQEVTGAITTTDKEDWFKIVIPRSGTYMSRVMSYQSSLHVYIYNYDLSKRVAAYYYVSGNLSGAGIESNTHKLEAGTYYIKVNGGGGKYKFLMDNQACSHTYKASKVKATYFSQGYTHYTCSKCGASYNGSYTAKLSIPKESISSIRGAKKKLTLSWKKMDGVSGYQIRYSTSKNFKKNVKTVTVKKANTSKKTIKKLKSKKNYYVQVRAYAAKDGMTVYGKWSAKKKVKVK